MRWIVRETSKWPLIGFEWNEIKIMFCNPCGTMKSLIYDPCLSVISQDEQIVFKNYLRLVYSGLIFIWCGICALTALSNHLRPNGLLNCAWSRMRVPAANDKLITLPSVDWYQILDNVLESKWWRESAPAQSRFGLNLWLGSGACQHNQVSMLRSFLGWLNS